VLFRVELAGAGGELAPACGMPLASRLTVAPGLTLD
jgi:hypothetical protein